MLCDGGCALNLAANCVAACPPPTRALRLAIFLPTGGAGWQHTILNYPAFGGGVLSLAANGMRCPRAAESERYDPAVKRNILIAIGAILLFALPAIAQLGGGGGLVVNPSEARGQRVAPIAMSMLRFTAGS